MFRPETQTPSFKYWSSLTSVKALIFLLRLNNLSNKILFLPFWASISGLTPSFHTAVSSSKPSSFPQPAAVTAVIPNGLNLVFHYARRNDNDPGNWHANWVRSLCVERVKIKNQGLPAGARWKNRKNFLASANEIQANLLLITKRFHIQEMLDYIVFSSFDVRVIR